MKHIKYPTGENIFYATLIETWMKISEFDVIF